MQQGISQEKMAEKMGLTKNYYGQFERGERGQSLDRLFQICEILSTPMEAFFEGTYSVTKFSNPPAGNDYDALILDVFRGRSADCKETMLEVCRSIAKLDK